MNNVGRNTQGNDDPTLQSLSSVPSGKSVTIRHLTDGPALDRLREIGMDDGRHIKVLGGGDPFICQIGQARVALGRRLARGVVVSVHP